MFRRVVAACLPLILLLLCDPLGAARAVAADGALQGAGLFVGVGYGGFRGWSTDGESWTAERWSDKNDDDDNIICGLCQRDAILLSCGGGSGKGYMLRSLDGKHWDEVAKSRNRMFGVLPTGDHFFSVFNEHFQTSTDGLKWVQLAAATANGPDGGGFFRRAAYGKGVVVFGGDYGFNDGRPREGWMGSTRMGENPLVIERLPSDLVGLAFGNDRFIGCTQKGQILTSDDGKKFVESGSSGDKHWDRAVQFIGDKFYLVGEHGTKISTDGKKWEALAKAPHLPRAVAPNGVAVDIVWGGILVAPDGKTFHKAKVNVDATALSQALYFVPAANRAK